MHFLPCAACRPAGITSGDAVMLELAAAEMAQAAALFVALEKEVEVLKAKGAESSVIQLKDTARYTRARCLRNAVLMLVCRFIAAPAPHAVCRSALWSCGVRSVAGCAYDQH